MATSWLSNKVPTAEASNAHPRNSARPSIEPPPRLAPLDSPGKSLRFVSQVFLCDFTAKSIWALASLALIRFLSEGQYAALTLALALSGLMVDGVTGSLNRVYIVGYTTLRLAAAPLAFLTLQLAVLAVSAALMFGFSGQVDGLHWLIVALALANGAHAIVRTMLQRELKFWSFSLLEIARTMLFLLGMVALIVTRGENVRAWEVLLVQVVSVSAIAGPALFRNLEPGRLGRPRDAGRIARQIATSGYALMIAYCLAVAVLTRIDVVMLNLLDTRLELATYGAAFRYYAMLTLLLAAVHTVLLPLTQQAKGRSQLEAMFVRYQRLVLAVVPVLLLGAWLSGWFMPLVDGGKYPGAVDVFRVLTMTAVIGLMYSPYVNLLLRYNDFVFLLGLVIAILFLDVGLNVLFIPRLHALGAALALGIASGAMNFLICLRARALLASRLLPVDSDDEPQTALAAGAE